MDKRDSILLSCFLCRELKKEFGVISMYEGDPVKDPDRHAGMYQQIEDIEDYLNGVWIESNGA